MSHTHLTATFFRSKILSSIVILVFILVVAISGFGCGRQSQEATWELSQFVLGSDPSFELPENSTTVNVIQGKNLYVKAEIHNIGATAGDYEWNIRIDDGSIHHQTTRVTSDTRVLVESPCLVYPIPESMPLGIHEVSIGTVSLHFTVISQPTSAEISDVAVNPSNIALLNASFTITGKISNPGTDNGYYNIRLHVDGLLKQSKIQFNVPRLSTTEFTFFETNSYHYGIGRHNALVTVDDSSSEGAGDFWVSTGDSQGTGTSGSGLTTDTPSPTISPTTSATPSPTPTLTPISTNLSSWRAEAYDPLIDEYYGPALWSLSSDGESVNEVQNCQPAFFYSDFSMMSRSINVNIKPLLAAEPDDDYIGFALGFQPGDTKNHNADFLLMDWKASIAGESLNKDFISSCGTGGTAKVGLVVSRVKGIPNTDEFWQHLDQEVACSPIGEGLFELARGTSLGNQGWEFNREYTITFELNKTSLKIYVDNNLEIDIKGNFKDGRLAFFNFSQAEVTYSISQ
jgi:hypothetical protein